MKAKFAKQLKRLEDAEARHAEGKQETQQDMAQVYRRGCLCELSLSPSICVQCALPFLEVLKRTLLHAFLQCGILDCMIIVERFVLTVIISYECNENPPKHRCAKTLW